MTSLLVGFIALLCALLAPRPRRPALRDCSPISGALYYVDLNPVRAGLAAGLDDSSWTSIQQRLHETVLALHAGEAAADKNDSPAE
jgi:hypothetical protein